MENRKCAKLYYRPGTTLITKFGKIIETWIVLSSIKSLTLYKYKIQEIGKILRKHQLCSALLKARHHIKYKIW